MTTECNVEKINDVAVKFPLKSSSDFYINVDDTTAFSVEPVRNESGLLLLDFRVYGLDPSFNYRVCVRNGMSYRLGIDKSERCHRATLFVREQSFSWMIQILDPVKAEQHAQAGGTS